MSYLGIDTVYHPSIWGLWSNPVWVATFGQSQSRPCVVAPWKGEWKLAMSNTWGDPCFVTSLDYRPLPNVRGHLSRRIMPRTPCSSIFQVRHVVFGRNTLFAGGCWQEIVAAGSQQILSLVTQHATVSADRWFPLVLILHGRGFLVPLNRNQWVFRVKKQISDQD